VEPLSTPGPEASRVGSLGAEARDGYAPLVEAAYTAALARCQGHEEIPSLLPVLRGLVASPVS
jgi:hypothetical protein